MLYDLLRTEALAHPDRIALQWPARQVSYAALWAQLEAAALHTRAIANAPRASSALGLEAAVAFAPEPRPRDVIHLLTHVAHGIPCVLLHPRWSSSERRAALAAVGPVPVVDAPSHPLAAPAQPQPSEAPGSVFSEERCLAVLFTSGSMGAAQAVVLSHSAFTAAAMASAERLGWEPEDRWLLSLPLAHVAGLSILTRCLLAGRTVVFPDPDEPLTPERLARSIEQQAPTLLSLVPTQLLRLLRLPDWRLPSCVRVMLVGGAACPRTALQHALDRGWPIRLSYGMTETCAQVATTHASQELPTALPLLTGVQARLEGGVIQIKSPSLLSGYLRQGQLAQALDSEGWYTTGDRGVLTTDGALEILGRHDALLITGGENVDPAQVEATLLEHAACSAACVVGLPDEEWGQRLAAAVVLTSAAQEPAFRQWIRRELAPHKRPKQLLTLPELPLTAAGKVDRQQIIARLCASARAWSARHEDLEGERPDQSKP